MNNCQTFLIAIASVDFNTTDNSLHNSKFEMRYAVGEIQIFRYFPRKIVIEVIVGKQAAPYQHIDCRLHYRLLLTRSKDNMRPNSTSPYLSFAGSEWCFGMNLPNDIIGMNGYIKAQNCYRRYHCFIRHSTADLLHYVRARYCWCKPR